MEKAREFQKNIYICFIDYVKAFDVWITTNYADKETGVPDHLTCLLKNLYAGQEAMVRTGHGTIDWFKTGKGSILSLCLFNFLCRVYHANVRLVESQLGIKIARRNINNLRYADDITLTPESEEPLYERVKEESEKADSKLNIQKTSKIMAPCPITSWQIDDEKVEMVTDYIFPGSKITVDSD